MGIIEFVVIVVATVLSWPLIERLVRSTLAIILGIFLPADKIKLTYTDADGNTHKTVLKVDNFKAFVDELKQETKGKQL